MRPSKITLKRNDKRLEIAWSDGHVCGYALDLLREACPCVECRGGHENMGKPIDADSLLLSIPLVKSKSYEIARLEPVGNYALKPTWTDGHDTGLYTWAYLRELCDGLEEAARRKSDALYRPITD
jgi:DUF971 family protein